MLDWLRRVASQVNQIDRELVRSSAAIPPSPADPGLKMLTTAANHSVLWFVVAAVLASRKGVTRRAAMRGIVAIGGASFAANVLAKPVLPRRRPAYEDVPVARRLDHGERPDSSSFPSGHAASAAAFATAVTMESPPVGMVVAPVAAAVAYSRVHTGVHWPSDVAAGMLMGAGVALATRRWWPPQADEPAESKHPARVRGLPDDGEGLVMLVNPQSGVVGEHPGDQLAAAWPAAHLVFCQPGIDLTDQLEAELDASDRLVRALGVAGGDGTVAAVAAVAASRGLPLVVVPAGTFNHFARNLGINELQDAVDAVRRGSAVAVDLGAVQVDDAPPRWFVNTASLGGYPDLVKFRKVWEPRWGKWPAAAAALIRVLRESDPLAVLIDGVPQQVWLVFVGNGPYRPRGFAATRHRLDTGLLDIRYIRADRCLSRTRFIIGALSGALERSRTYTQRESTELRIEVLQAPVTMAADGEVAAKGCRFRFWTRPAALEVFRPDPQPKP